MIPKLPVALAALVTLPLAVQADVLTVPGDFAKLQDAVNAALPGDTVVVDGGRHHAVTVNVPITLMGTNGPVIGATTEDPFSFATPPPILMRGSGFGTLTVVGFAFGGLLGGISSGCEAAIAGDGFEELRVFDCEVTAPSWSGPSGIAAAPHGISTPDVASILVVRSNVVAADSDDDGFPYGLSLPGGFGINAPASDVLLLESTVRGGDAVDVTGSVGAGCPNVGMGEGGTAVDANMVTLYGSTVLGGEGASIFDQVSQGVGVLCEVKPDGPPTGPSTLVVTLAGGLNATGRLAPGESWDLSWDVSALAGALYVSVGIGEPALDVVGQVAPVAGLNYLATAPRLVIPVGTGPGSKSFALPPGAGLLGVEVAAQLVDGGLSGPVVTIVQP